MTKARRHRFKTLMTSAEHCAAAVRLVGYTAARKMLEEVISLDKLERRCRKTQERKVSDES